MPAKGTHKRKKTPTAKEAGAKAATAKAEVEESGKSVKWQGLTLTLPDELPESVVFDMVEMEASGNGMSVLRTLRTLLGPRQFNEVRYKLEELGADANSDALFDDIFPQYGMTLGE
jgi:hypothetical protein